jgi:hypothetical protein
LCNRLHLLIYSIPFKLKQTHLMRIDFGSGRTLIVHGWQCWFESSRPQHLEQNIPNNNASVKIWRKEQQVTTLSSLRKWTSCYLREMRSLNQTDFETNQQLQYWVDRSETKTRQSWYKNLNLNGISKNISRIQMASWNDLPMNWD